MKLSPGCYFTSTGEVTVSCCITIVYYFTRLLHLDHHSDPRAARVRSDSSRAGLDSSPRVQVSFFRMTINKGKRSPNEALPGKGAAMLFRGVLLPQLTNSRLA